MKSLFIYLGIFLTICSISFYQSCQNSDHIECRTFTGIRIAPFDITTYPYKLMNDSDEVYAKKFAFSFESITGDTLCMAYPTRNIIQSAYATRVNATNIFMKDSIQSIEIYSTTNFNSQYPAGAILNNLFTIPTLFTNVYTNSYNNYDFYQLITLNEVPQQSDFFKFFVRLKTKEGKVLTDSLPTIKIKI